MIYNCRKKTFADGTQQYFYGSARERDFTEDKPKKKTGKKQSKEKREESRKRAVQVVFDIAKSNIWDWFITLTFDTTIVDHYSYDDCCKALRLFTKKLQKLGCIWLILPDLHKKGGIHFHGLVKGPLPHEKAFTPDGRRVLDDKGHRVYNIPIFAQGFTTAIKCYSQSATGYVAKYITKCDCVPDGKKRYWASRACQKPSVEYLEMSMDEYCAIFNDADYKKSVVTPYGVYELLEKHGAGD